MSRFSHFIYAHFYYRLMNKCIDLFYHLSVKKNKIVILHDFGLGYGDSPKYIAEALLKETEKYHIVWLVNDKKLYIPRPIRKVYLARIRSVYELATAKVIITTMKGRLNLKKKNDQFLVYIPHGQSGAKYVEKAARNLNPSYIENSIWHSSVSDLFISSSKMQTQEMRNYFWYDYGEIMECGLPRNDIFFNYAKEDILHIREKIGLNNNEHIILYAPTFRNKGDHSVYDIDVSSLLDALEDKVKKKCKFLIRSHPNFVWYGKLEFEKSERVIDVTHYPDMQELLLISDFLISDYSSTIFDFMLLKRPIFLYVKDMIEYQEMRGLKDWFPKVPFPICENNKELIYAITNFDLESYYRKLKNFDKIYGTVEHGTATKEIVNRLKKVMYE